MSPAPSRPEPTDRATQRDEDAQYYRDILHELVEMATDIARAVHRQATAAPAPAPEQASQPAPDSSIAFDRIARTLRRTIALARKLAEPAPLSPATQAAERRRIARKQIIRAVEDTIQRETSGADAEALHAEFYERLDTIDLDDDLDNQPIADIIALIRRDLGIANLPGTHPWKRRTPQDVRELSARAARSPGARTTVPPRTIHPTTGNPRPIPAPPPRTRPSTGPPAP